MATSKLALCPACGKPVYFQGAANVAGCGCNKVWYREGDALTEIAEMRQIHGASDVIQPGTTGRWDGINFSVAGRLRLWFENTAYNYWTLDCPDGTVRYLAEGYGMYAVYEALAQNPAVMSRKFRIEAPANQLDLLDEGNFVISARQEAVHMEVEGSVSLPAFPTFFKTIEASSENRHIEIIGYGQDFAVAYLIRPIIPEHLFLENTRDEPLQGKTFSCTHCATKTWVKTYPYAQSWVCEGCNTCYSLKNGGGEQLDHAYNVMSKPLFPFDTGEHISIHGVTYDIIGVSFKQEKYSEDATWREYTLYEKLHGFAFLAESEGHWTILKETRAAASPLRINDTHIRIRQDLFKRFTQYNSKILFATGEFPGDIFKDHELTDVIEYIAPPKLLSIEKDTRHNLTWFAGEYVKWSDLRSQAHRGLPQRVGTAPTQVRMKVDIDALIRSAVIGVLLVLFVQIVTGGFNRNRVLVNANYQFADSLSSQTFITEKFKLDKWRGNIQLKIDAPVNNSWFELNATLVNADNGTEYNIEQGVEYYHGVDSDGSWSEGSNRETAYFTSIPEGNYFLQFNGMRGYGDGIASYFGVRATYDLPTYRNVFIIMLLAVLWPIALAIADYYFEQQRWANSPFSNFQKNKP